MTQISVIDTTLRDGHQSLWATRMTTGMMLPVAEKMDRAGFHAIDLMGAIHFDVCVRYLKEDPWQRIRLMRERVRRTPMQASIRSKNLLSFGVVPDDILELWIERLVANGIGRIRCFDALADFDNIADSLKLAKRLGVETVCGLVYTISPVHTDEHYAEKAKEIIKRANPDVIMLKDSDGLLTIDRIRTLVPAMKAVMGSTILELHSHCLTGLAPIVYLEGVKLGCQQVQTAIPPLADGASQPSTRNVVRNLRHMGYTVDIDDGIIDEVSEHFMSIARSENKPIGAPVEYDLFHYEHQMPGGMLTNFKSQLAAAGISHRYPEVLQECAQIRAELGWPIMVSPFAQLVGTQAVLNVINGERYRSVPDEIKKYALGHYGKLLAPIDQNILDRIMENGSPSISANPQPLDPAVPGLRKRYPNMSDDERLLRFMFAGGQVDDMRTAGPMKTEYSAQTPVVRLLRELSSRRNVSSFSVRRDGMQIKVTRQPTA